MKKTLYTFLPLILTLAMGMNATAQRDTLAGMRRFLKVCGDYQQLPMQLDLEIASTTNLILGKADTTAVRASFYLCGEGSYIEMGGVEQLANDSLLLLVNKATKRMILMPNYQSVGARLKQTLGMLQQDSSADRLAAKYIATEDTASGDTTVIRLQSRTFLALTQLPREQITLRYKAATKRPAEVITLKRTLLPVSDSVYKEAVGRAEWAGKTASFHDSSFYLIKEQVTVFRYLKVTHEPGDHLPGRVSDRLVAKGPGEYRPTGSYADFVLSRQF